MFIAATGHRGVRNSGVRSASCAAPMREARARCPAPGRGGSRPVTTLRAERALVNGQLTGPVTVDFGGGCVRSVRLADGPADVALLTPGMVDLQVNGVEGTDVGSADVPALAALDRAQALTGVTDWYAALVTTSLPEYDTALRRLTAAAGRPGSRLRGVHLEGPFLTVAGAHPPGHLRDVDAEWLAALPPVVRLMTLAPELPGALDAVRSLSARGVQVSLGHSACSHARATEAADSGAVLVTHLFNATGPLHHRRPGLVTAGLTDPRLHPMLIADGAHVDDAWLRVAFAAAGQRVVLVTDSVAAASGRLGGGPVSVLHGAPRRPDGVLAGSVLTLDAAVRRCVRAGVDAAQALAAAATTPRRLMGLPDPLSVGSPADLVAWTPDLRVDTTWLAGTEVAA